MLKSPAFNDTHTNVCKLVELLARCDINAGGTINASSVTPAQLGTWSTPGTGRYLLTLADPLPNVGLMFPGVTLQSATAQDITAHVSVLTTSTVEIRTLTGAVATAPTAACSLHLQLMASNSSV